MQYILMQDQQSLTPVTGDGSFEIAPKSIRDALVWHVDSGRYSLLSALRSKPLRLNFSDIKEVLVDRNRDRSALILNGIAAKIIFAALR
jgi:hypothetical protein